MKPRIRVCAGHLGRGVSTELRKALATLALVVDDVDAETADAGSTAKPLLFFTLQNQPDSRQIAGVWPGNPGPTQPWYRRQSNGKPVRY